MHKVAPTIEAAVSIPLLHISDATADAIKAAGLAKIGLLSTRFTMAQAFYKERLVQHGLQVLIPSEAEREVVHQIIYQELCLGKIHDTSRQQFRAIMANLTAQGAQGIIWGCTEKLGQQMRVLNCLILRGFTLTLRRCYLAMMRCISLFAVIL